MNRIQQIAIQQLSQNCDFCNNTGEIIVGAPAEQYDELLKKGVLGIQPCPICNKLESEI